MHGMSIVSNSELTPHAHYMTPEGTLSAADRMRCCVTTDYDVMSGLLKQFAQQADVHVYRAKTSPAARGPKLVVAYSKSYTVDH